MDATTQLASDKASALASGKGSKDENFPVASRLVKLQYRAPIMAFYRFARAADDIADHETASRDEKLRLLAEMRAGLDGDGAPQAMALREVMAERELDPIQAHDLLDAFVQDVTRTRYADWDDLVAYCRKSAIPVGRFVLDVHGEDRAIWPANDALCAALQVINHLQDCAKDYRTLDRVYIPAETFAATSSRVEDLGAERATPQLRAAIVELAGKTRALLDVSAPFAKQIKDGRLSMEVAVIQRLACDLVYRLETRDPLSERVHHGKWEALFLSGSAALGNLVRRAA
jgi:squalene synthase HpnC